MNGSLKCDCCSTREATLVLTTPTDASPERGTLYCDYCATASNADFASIHEASDLELGALVELPNMGDGVWGVLAVDGRGQGGIVDRFAVRVANGREIGAGGMQYSLRADEMMVVDTNVEEEPTTTRDRKIEHLAEQRDDAANAAKRTITKLRAELDRMEIALNNGLAGAPLYATDLTPSHQTLQEIVAHGVEFRTLWNATGLLSR